MHKSIKIIASIIIVIGVFCIAAYFSREYWIGSIIINAVSNSDDRKYLNVIPENYEITKNYKDNCSLQVFYNYSMCFPWNDIHQKSDGKTISWVRFNDGPMIFISNPAYEGDIRSDFQREFYDNNFVNIGERFADGLKSMAETTLTNSSYKFLETILYSSHDSYKIFTPFKKVYSQLPLLLGKITICRLRTGVYCEKILSFHNEQLKGFQINFPAYKEVKFYDLYIFPNDNEYLKIKILGDENRVKQAEIDMLISSICKRNNITMPNLGLQETAPTRRRP